jgi:hypothetical protein
MAKKISAHGVFWGEEIVDPILKSKKRVSA